ncbi:MAG: AmmeMemoRadiSam system protein A, partial [Lachnospiraceae bacterium]|nr:AmmeMemoRadiSam system protein A [Lachnospiraceae bacterium]
RPEDPDDEMENTRAGAFVSIHEHGMLRGCIGTFLPTQNTLTEEIIQNAISASTRDPRFAPIREEELDQLEINVDILSEPESIDSIDALDARRYGVIVCHGRKRGLLLPDLDGVDTPAQQIEICKQKAGIHPDEKDLELYRFEVVRHV